MNRSMRSLAVLLACVFVLAACSSSGSGKTATTETIGNSVPATDPPTVPARAIPVSACSLVTTAQVKRMLGSTATGVEADQSPSYKTCTWTTTPKGSATPTKLGVGVIRLGNGQVGFGSTVVGMTPTVLQGVGKVASYSSGVTSSGAALRLLVAKNTSVSVSIDVIFGSSAQPPSSLQSDVTAIARSIFVKLP